MAGPGRRGSGPPRRPLAGLAGCVRLAGHPGHSDRHGVGPDRAGASPAPVEVPMPPIITGRLPPAPPENPAVSGPGVRPPRPVAFPSGLAEDRPVTLARLTCRRAGQS
jgi:hypothetical protein